MQEEKSKPHAKFCESGLRTKEKPSRACLALRPDSLHVGTWVSNILKDDDPSLKLSLSRFAPLRSATSVIGFQTKNQIKILTKLRERHRHHQNGDKVD